jgi:hypothetical protein
MSIPFYSARTMVENKLAPYLTATVPGVTVHKGVTPEIKVLPMVTIYAESASPASALGSRPLGNYEVTISVRVISSADDETLDTHRTRVQEVINALANIDAIKALWTYSTDGILYDLFITGGDQEGEHQRKYGNMIEFTAFVAAPPAP